MAEVEKLRRVEENYRITLNSIGDAVIATDINGCITLMNSVAERMTGWKLEKAKGRPADQIIRIINSITGETIPNPVKEVIETGKIAGRANHTKLISKNAQEYQIADSSAPIKDIEDKTVGVVLVFRDITDLKGKEQELAEREAFTQVVMDNLPVGIAVNSVFPSVEFIYMNDYFHRIYRTTREELSTPDNFWNAVYEDPEFRIKIKKRVEEDISSGDPKRMHWEDIPVTRQGKRTRYISAHNIPVPEKNIWISTVIDVTEHKKAREELSKLKNNLEIQVEKQTKVLKEKLVELERFHEATIEREFRIKELRNEIDMLKKNSGQEE